MNWQEATDKYADLIDMDRADVRKIFHLLDAMLHSGMLIDCACDHLPDIQSGSLADDEAEGLAELWMATYADRQNGPIFTSIFPEFYPGNLMRKHLVLRHFFSTSEIEGYLNWLDELKQSGKAIHGDTAVLLRRQFHIGDDEAFMLHRFWNESFTVRQRLLAAYNKV